MRIPLLAVLFFSFLLAACDPVSTMSRSVRLDYQPPAECLERALASVGEVRVENCNTLNCYRCMVWKGPEAWIFLSVREYRNNYILEEQMSVIGYSITPEFVERTLIGMATIEQALAEHCGITGFPASGEFEKSGLW